MRPLGVLSILFFLLFFGCGGGGEDRCDIGVSMNTSTIALGVDGGAADLGATSCMDVCQSHASELCGGCAGQVGFTIESCGFVPIDGDPGVRCTFSQEVIGCP
jgi:hypothetical protein